MNLEKKDRSYFSTSPSLIDGVMLFAVLQLCTVQCVHRCALSVLKFQPSKVYSTEQVDQNWVSTH